MQDENDKGDYAKPEKSGVMPCSVNDKVANCFHTKKENGWRFDKALLEERYEEISVLPCGGRINFMREDPLAALYESISSGPNYNPAVDEDRWQIVCPNLKREACPGWDCLRKVLREAAEKERVNNEALMQGTTVEENEYFPNGNAYAARIRNGNGVAGPIVGTRYGYIEIPKEIVEVARECGKAAQAAEDAARANAHGEDVEVCHGGIIAFLKWFFGWKGKR